MSRVHDALRRAQENQDQPRRPGTRPAAARADAVRAEAARWESAPKEPARTEAAPTETARTEPARTETPAAQAPIEKTEVSPNTAPPSPAPSISASAAPSIPTVPVPAASPVRNEPRPETSIRTEHTVRTAPPVPPSPSVSQLDVEHLEEIIQLAKETPYHTLKDALVVNPMRPREAPAEEFRSLRTRLDHMQSLQPLHTVVVTSASPAEG